jgi:thioredoxin reductase
VTVGDPGRPFPPGAYPVVVVGSGPGGLQVSHALTEVGIDHAVISQDPSPGGMFRRWPFFQRLLSWTKPHAPVEHGTRAYERYDWNSLLTQQKAAQALAPTFMDGSSYFPSRPEMEANLAAFAERARVAVRYGCTWTGTRVEERAGGTAFVVETSDGEYRCRILVLAVGVAEPHVPDAPGIELAHHYGEVKPVKAYAGKRVFILGKQNSGFELASGMLPWARQIVLSSPSPASLSVDTRSLVGVRARYVQPYEDHVLGGGVSVLDASIGSIEQLPDGALRAHLHRSDGGGEMAIDADEIIAATGFTAPLLDLPKLGCQVFGASRLPVQTPWWESATLPGVFFAGTLGQGARGLRKHGIPANSGAVHGARYNARVLARRLAEERFGIGIHRPVMEPETLVDFLTREITEAPDLFHQRAYLGRVVTADPITGLRDAGVQPLAHVLDEGAEDAIVVTLEADGSGAIYPVLYTRIGGAVNEHPLDPDPLLRYDGAETRAAIGAVVGPVLSANGIQLPAG